MHFCQQFINFDILQLFQHLCKFVFSLHIMRHTQCVTANSVQCAVGKMYSNFRNYAPPSFLPQICPPFFWGQFSQNSMVGDAWLKASLVLQHSLYYPLKNWALLVPKYGRAVKSIYSYNLFSSFATKKWHFYRKYAPPPQTQLGSSQYGEVVQNKQILWLKISSHTPISVSTSLRINVSD